MVPGIQDRHTQGQIALGLNAHMSFKRLNQRRVNGIPHCHAVNDGTVGLKPPARHKADGLTEKLRLFFIAGIQGGNILLSQIHIEMGGHIQTKGGEFHTGMIHDVRRLGIHEHVPLALGRVARGIGKGIFVQSKGTGNGNDLFDHRFDFRRFLHGHSHIAQGAGANKRDLTGICLHQVDDQVNRVLLTRRSHGSRKKILRLSVRSMGKRVLGPGPDHRLSHTLGHRDVCPLQHLQNLKRIYTGDLRRIIAIYGRDRQDLQHR